jgi:hypothetical protein
LRLSYAVFPAGSRRIRSVRASSNSAVGAYGLRVDGVGSARELLVPAEARWPAITIEREVFANAVQQALADDRATLRFTAEGAVIQLAAGGTVAIDRDARTARFATPAPVGDHELVHPYLGTVAAVFATWLGRECFHAGCFAADGGAWALLAEREGGKSSLLAWLALQGVSIVSDDILVLEGGRAYAGPRSIDLREEPARRLGVGEALGVVGVRKRWRQRTDPAPSGLPLRGWILLAWGPELSVLPLPAAERLATLASQVAIARPPDDPRVLLDLAALPAFELRRPRGWEMFDGAGARLLELVR